MKKSIFFLLFLGYLLVARPVQAASLPDCQPIFGGGASCEQNSPVSINKQVQNPENNAYVENLIPTDPQYKAEQTVLFKLIITNSTNAAVNNITVSDIFPPYINFTKGVGTFDSKNRILSIPVDQLKAKEVKIFFIEGQVVSNSSIPDGLTSRCVINQAQVFADNKTSQDNTLLCVSKTSGTTSTKSSTTTKGGLTIYPSSKSKTTPQTGPETSALLSLFGMGIFGFFLKNKAKT